MNKKVVVLGAGAWGTALALAALRAGQEVVLWARRPEFAEILRRTRQNEPYLPGVTLPPELIMTSDLTGATRDADWVLVVVPSVGVPELLQSLPRDLGLVLCSKGLAANGETLSAWAMAAGFKHVAVLSGPNHAEEVARGLPAATVVAGDEALCYVVREALMSSQLRVYTSADRVGVEWGGVLKNVLAVAAGMSDGLCLGDNAKAALLTRGLLEMNRFLLAVGAAPETVYGLSGLGDLIATATSIHSRNRAAGEALARGEYPIQGAKVVEGLRTAGLLQTWAHEHGLELPIVSAVSAVALGRTTPSEAVSVLMERQPRSEHLIDEISNS